MILREDEHRNFERTLTIGQSTWRDVPGELYLERDPQIEAVSLKIKKKTDLSLKLRIKFYLYQRMHLFLSYTKIT